jgi:hypothetical protein
LAADSRQRAESLSSTLFLMSETATELAGEEHGNHDGRLRDSYMGEMRLAVAALHASSEQSMVHISTIVASSAHLCDELSSTRKSFSVGDLFSEAIGRARELLRTESSGESSAPSESVLANLAARDVHEVLFPGAVLPALPATGTDDLGDNVELF